MIQFNWSVVYELVLSDEVQVSLKRHVVKKVSMRDALIMFLQLSLLTYDEFDYACCPAMFNIPQLSICTMGLVNESPECRWGSVRAECR